jgi:hypothetical protein
VGQPDATEARAIRSLNKALAEARASVTASRDSQ